MPETAPLLPRLLPLGDTALTIEFGSEIDPRTNARVLGLAHALKAAVVRGELAGVVEWVPAFSSLTVHFAAEVDDPAELAEQLLRLAAAAPPRVPAGRAWRLPVCFDAELAPDLDALAAARGLQRREVIALLTETAFRVYMLGFLPGFAYLGGLPDACALPRRASPRQEVPARSLAVAGRMCAVYPWASPGGWHLLGRTPVRLFDATDRERPALLEAGDEVRWQAIDRETYAALDRLAERGRLDRSRLLASAEPQP